MGPRPPKGYPGFSAQKKRTGAVFAESWLLKLAICVSVTHDLAQHTRLVEAGAEIPGSNLQRVVARQLWMTWE
jgi:hypothetical protein